MNLDDILELARTAEEEEAIRTKRRQEEASRAAAAEMERRRAAFVEWLGDMAGDVDMDASWQGAEPRFMVRPKSWRLGAEGMLFIGDPDGTYRMVPPGYQIPVRVESVASPEFASFVLAAQREYERALAARVDRLRERLTVARHIDDGDPVARLESTRLELDRLAPERAAEWKELHAASLVRLGEMRAEEAEAEAGREAAVERYRAAMTAWAGRFREVRDHNERIARQLRERLGDVTLTVREVEYALVSPDDDGDLWLETRTVMALGGAGDTWSIPDPGRGACRTWTFRHVIRVSEPMVVRPEYPHRVLFIARCLADTLPVYTDYSAAHAAALAEAEALILPYPEPEWEGFETAEMYAIAAEARGMLRPDTAVEVPF